MIETLKPQVLLAEDDPSLGQLLSEFLEAKGYIVQWVKNGKEALNAWGKGNFNIIILDVMMPVMDGFSTARAIRALNPVVPILFLTAKSDITDKSEGFGLGGDDYMTKPFSMQELVMRINALLKRSSIVQEELVDSPDEIKIGQLLFKYSSRQLACSGVIQKLTTREADLLRLLSQHKGRVLSREEALKKIWGDDSWFNGRSMDVFISKLRKYLKKDTNIEILNVHGTGFRLINHSDG